MGPSQSLKIPVGSFILFLFWCCRQGEDLVVYSQRIFKILEEKKERKEKNEVCYNSLKDVENWGVLSLLSSVVGYLPIFISIIEKTLF